MSLPQKSSWSDFSVQEWYRLSAIADEHDRALKQAYLKTVVQGQQPNSLFVRNVITDAVVETGVTSANVYGMVFNPNSPVYRRLIDRLTEKYMKVVQNENARDRVREILPHNLSLSERRDRLDVFGLDARSAVRLERMRQSGVSDEDIQQARLNFSVQRGNLIALTEINRVINYTLEALWIDNLRISKAVDDEVWYFDDSIASNVVSIAQLPKRSKKEIVTRRDDRVCNYCYPLDGTTARLGVEFDTDYGLFQAPPFHPRCRCFMIVSI